MGQKHSLNFCANLTLLFGEYPMNDRFAEAARCGFQGVEILFPYDQHAREIQKLLAMNNLDFVLMNCPPPNYTGGKPGYAAQPEQSERFRRDFGRALRLADILRPRVLHIMSGEAEGDAAHQCFVENLKWACAEAQSKRPTQILTIEPINLVDKPGYFLCDFDHALTILDEVGAPNLFLQFDAYHAHRLTGDVLATWEKCKARTAHIQVAGFPGRHEPQNCEIDYASFFAAVADSGFDGWVSGEYYPAKRTEDGLDWIAH